MKQILKKYKIPIIAVLFLISILLINGFKIKREDLPNLVGLAIGAIALGFTVSGSEESKEDKIQGAIAKLREESDRRDGFHERELAQLQRELVAIVEQINFHQHDIGHKGTLQQIFEIKDKLANHEAVLAVLTKQGEMLLAINTLREDVARLKAEKLSSE